MLEQGERPPGAPGRTKRPQTASARTAASAGRAGAFAGFAALTGGMSRAQPRPSCSDVVFIQVILR